MACGLRADRARLRLRLGGDAHDGAARRRRVRAQRRQALHHERGSREPLRRLREDRSRRAGHSGHLGLRRRGRRAGVRGRPHRAEDGHQGLDDRRDLLQRLPRSRRRTCSAREGEGFKIAMRILDRSRPGIGAQGLGLAQGATDYALEYAKIPRDDGQADRAAPADRRDARRHGDEVRGRARPPLQGRDDDRRGRRPAPS